MTAITSNSWYKSLANGVYNLAIGAGQLAGHIGGFVAGGSAAAIATRMVASKLLPLAAPGVGPVMVALGAAEALSLYTGYHVGNKCAEIGSGYGTIAAEKTVEAVNWSCEKAKTFLPNFSSQVKSESVATVTPKLSEAPAPQFAEVDLSTNPFKYTFQ